MSNSHRSYDSHLLRSRRHRSWYFFYRWFLTIFIGCYFAWLLAFVLPQKIATIYQWSFDESMAQIAAVILSPFMMWFSFCHVVHRVSIICISLGRGWGVLGMIIVPALVLITAPFVGLFGLIKWIFSSKG